MECLKQRNGQQRNAEGYSWGRPRAKDQQVKGRRSQPRTYLDAKLKDYSKQVGSGFRANEKVQRTKLEKNRGQEKSRRVKRRLRGDKNRTRRGQEKRRVWAAGSRGGRSEKLRSEGQDHDRAQRPSQRGAWRLGQDFSLANEEGGGSTIAYFSGAWDGEETERRGEEMMVKTGDGSPLSVSVGTTQPGLAEPLSPSRHQ